MPERLNVAGHRAALRNAERKTAVARSAYEAALRYEERMRVALELAKREDEDAWGMKHDRPHRDPGKGRAARTVRGERGDEE